MSENKKSPVKTVSLMMIITLAGKVLGLIRDRLLTVNYGSGMEANAFWTASRIPRVFFDTIFASAISACLIPVFSEYLRKNGRKDAFKFAGNFITVMAVLCSVLTVLGVLFAEQMTAFFADGYDAETAALCASLTRIMMPTILFTGVAFSFVGVLQSMEEFNIPAAISLVSNAAVIIYYFTLNKKYGIYGLAVTFLIAWLLQALVQLPSLKKKGFKFVPSLSLRSEGMRKVFRLMLPVMVSTWVLPINQTINSKFGSRLFEGAGVSAIELAYNLYTVIAGVFVLSVTNYIFPRLSKENADGDAGALKKTISGTMHSTLFIVIPMTAGLCVMAEPLINFIYGGGEFDAFSVGITSRALMYMSLGMIGYAAQAVLSRVYFAEQNGRTPLVAGAVSIAANILLCWALTERFDVAGIALASAISFTINGLILALPLKRQGLGFTDGKFVVDMVKIAGSGAVMAAAVYGLRRLLEGRCGKLIVLAVPVAAGVVLYCVLTTLLRMPETQLAMGFIKKRFGKGGGNNA
ncbi:MAG: murein biosynthesis integral membrane protein MurJ [Oscillospiraceae bacterium]